MAETIETGLVYIHRTKPTKGFVGCGALIERGLIATCRHVWREATKVPPASTLGEPLEVEVEYPRAREGGASFRSPAGLADACDDTQVVDPIPDLVLLEPARIPSEAFPLHLAAEEKHETGAGYVHARVRRTDQQGHEIWQEAFPKGEIGHLTNEGLREFNGIGSGQYWFTSGSSGSPLFLELPAQQLAGILSLSELGANEGKNPLQEAFIVPATAIRRFVSKRAARPVAESKGIDAAALQSILDAIGLDEVPVAEIPARLKQFVDEARAHAAEPVRPSNDGADIEAVIGASRDKLRDLDIGGARELLQTKILDEQEARTRRLVPLLREKAWLERLAMDYEAAKATFAELTALTPDDVWAWIELGDLWRTTGSLDGAARAYRAAEAAARRTGTERDLSVSHDRIGDVRWRRATATAPSKPTKPGW